MAIGEASGAARVARRLVDAAPRDPTAQQLAYESCRAAGHHIEAEQYARRWQAAVPDRELAPDAAIAEGLLHKGDFSGALTLLAPHGAEAADSGAHSRSLAIAAEAHAGIGNYEAAFSLIEPRLTRSATWRNLAARLASEQVAQPGEAARWLNAVEAVTAQLGQLPVDPSSTTTADFTRERLNLATAWARLGHRLQDSQALEYGYRQLAELTAGSLKQDPDAWEALAEVAAWADDQEGVEAAYRRVLALDPRRARSANHLARLLLGSKEPSARAEALTWAAVAAEQVPVEANYHNTLGRAYLAAGELSLARVPFERALRLNATHLDAMLGYASLLSRAGEREIAARWFNRLDPIYRTSGSQPADLAAEYEQLRRQFSQP
jgi:Tfp pilus assembly protein PilF